jgi:hypothetical protein
MSAEARVVKYTNEQAGEQIVAIVIVHYDQEKKIAAVSPFALELLIRDAGDPEQARLDLLTVVEQSRRALSLPTIDLDREEVEFPDEILLKDGFDISNLLDSPLAEVAVKYEQWRTKHEKEKGLHLRRPFSYIPFDYSLPIRDPTGCHVQPSNEFS